MKTLIKICVNSLNKKNNSNEQKTNDHKLKQILKIKALLGTTSHQIFSYKLCILYCHDILQAKLYRHLNVKIIDLMKDFKN